MAWDHTERPNSEWLTNKPLTLSFLLRRLTAAYSLMMASPSALLTDCISSRPNPGRLAATLVAGDRVSPWIKSQSNHKQRIERLLSHQHSSRVLQPQRLRRNMSLHRLQVADAAFQGAVHIEGSRPGGSVHGHAACTRDGNGMQTSTVQ